MPLTIRARALPVALALSATLLPPVAHGADPARSFRLVTMDMRQDLGDTLSYETYRAHLSERITTASSAFAEDGRETLVVLPEDAGLMAWLVGARGEVARHLNNSSAAVASLAVPYAPQVAYYEAKCPGIPPARALVLSLTDTAWRAFGETLAKLAAEHGVWIMANLNAPEIAVVRDPARAALLGDPSAGTPYAYEGGCDNYNTAFLFPPTATVDADGAAEPGRVLHGMQRKGYLVPIERTQDVGLAMTGELMRNVHPIVTPFAHIGVLTSKDAWMPDFTERLDDEGMEVFVQPEAGPWAGYGAGLPDWPPDAMHRAIWAQVQRLPETRVGALSNLTGNFFDLYFDGTATITADATPDGPEGFLLGRLPERGYVARAPWIVADPPDGFELSDWQGRRGALSSWGAKLLPGSGHPLENTQREGFVWTDVELPARASGERVARAPGLDPSIRVSETSEPQWSPSVGFAGGGATVAWTDLLGGNERPALAHEVGPGFTDPLLLGRDRRPSDQQGNSYDARVAIHELGINVVWTDFRNQSWSIWGAAGGPSGVPVSEDPVDHSPTTNRSSAEGFPTENINHDPVIAAAPDGRIYAAWADVRGRRVPWRIGVARGVAGSTAWLGDERADGGGGLEQTPEELDAVDGTARGDQFAPAVAVGPDGAVWVAWQDHATADPQIVLSRSTDHAETFTRLGPVAPAGAAQYRPALAVDDDGTVAVAWEEQNGAGRAVKVAIAPSGGSFGPSAAVDPSAPAGARQARAAIAAIPGVGGFVVAWQDDRAGDRDLLAARVGTDGVGVAMRLDDGPDGADARLPAIAAGEGELGVAWEDTRTGVEQIMFTRFDPAALG